MHHAIGVTILSCIGLALSFYAGYSRGSADGELAGFQRGVARANRIRGNNPALTVRLRDEGETSGSFEVLAVPSLPEIPPDTTQSR
jgi:hypothetical protein